jgi:hypothetical protein
MDLHLTGVVATGRGLLLNLWRLLSAGRTGLLAALIFGLLLVGPAVLLATERGPAPDAGVSTEPPDSAAIEPSPAHVGPPATRAAEGQACSLHRPEKGLCGLPLPGTTSGDHSPRFSD